jgi:hypothetical protein
MLLRGMLWMAWFLYLAGCLLILSNTVADYRPSGPGIFIMQKGEIGESAFWKASLYVHIAGGLLCLFAALPQLSRKLVARVPALHRSAGKIYGASVLFLVCPTGFHLALYAKGGFFGKLGFLTLAFAAFYTTFAGWRAVLPPQRNMATHGAFERRLKLTSSWSAPRLRKRALRTKSSMPETCGSTCCVGVLRCSSCCCRVLLLPVRIAGRIESAAAAWHGGRGGLSARLGRMRKLNRIILLVFLK